MTITVLGMDTSKPVGEKLDPEVQAEVQALAPSSLDPGEVNTVHLATDAVTTDKIAPGAVGTTEIATDGVDSINIKSGAVGTSELATAAVTADKAGAGVMKAKDTAGNPLTLTLVPISALDYAALSAPDPNTLYGIY